MAFDNDAYGAGENRSRGLDTLCTSSSHRDQETQGRSHSTSQHHVRSTPQIRSSWRLHHHPRHLQHRSRWQPRHGFLSLLIWLVMLGVYGMLALRLLPAELANGRLVPEAVSFIPLLFVPIIACLALALWWRRFVLAPVALFALVVMGWWHVGFFIPQAHVSDAARAAVSTSSTTNDSAARIMTLNTKNGRASAAEIVATVRAQNVEILCLQELSQDLIDELATTSLKELLPYRLISAGASGINNGGRNGIWSRFPMSNTSDNVLPILTSSMPAADVQIGNRAVRVVSVHPNSPVRGAQDVWDKGLSTIGTLSEYDHAYLIMGDFNSTWDHARFRELLGSKFVDAGETSGEGFHFTYPSDGAVPPLVEIDHIVYTRDAGMTVGDLQTVKILGSDHMALLGTLEVS